MTPMNVHGTYPYGESGCPWKKIRDLTFEEAADMVKTPKEDREEAKHCGLWINKGYVVLELMETGNTGISSFQVGVLDSILEVRSLNIETGMRAVYLHDGRYSLLERMEPGN